VIARQTQQREERLIVSNKVGLHARPAALLVKVAQKFDAEIEVSLNGRKANAKSIMGLLTLCAECGAQVKVSASGDDAEEAIRAITDLFASNFHELPDPSVKEPMTKSMPPAKRPRGKGETILVADDEMGIRHMMRVVLENNGYRTIVARNGLDAIALFIAQPKDIKAAVLDMIMPEMNGWEALRAIRRMNPSLPVLAMSGSMEASPCPDDATTVFLRKPFGAAELLSTLRALMDDARRLQSVVGSN
jgi:phosphotransferase system HPr (HPr) family protein